MCVVWLCLRRACSMHTLSRRPGRLGRGDAAWLTAAVCAAVAGVAPIHNKNQAAKGHLSVLYGAAHSPGRRDYMQACRP